MVSVPLPVFAVALVGAASLGFALGLLLLLLPCFRGRQWPSSYIGDAMFHSGDAEDTFCCKRFASRFYTFVSVLWDRHPRPLDIEDEDFVTCNGSVQADELPQEPQALTGLSTIPRWRGNATPAPRSGPRWEPGSGHGFRMRVGPDYKRNARKIESDGHLYECISLDVIRADQKIERILGTSVIEVPPHHQVGDGALTWASGCALPRVICINVQLPYLGYNPFSSHDPGCSVVALFHITSNTLQTLEGPHQPPAMKLFQQFWERDAGNLSVVKQANAFKAVACCDNLQDILDGLMVADFAVRKNGTPVLITRSGDMFKDPQGEWLEVSVDVRLFATFARMMLQQCRDRLARASVRVGFLIQGTTDEELPEGLIGDVVVHNVHLERDARQIEVPRGGE